jgi:hypothetical protein
MAKQRSLFILSSKITYSGRFYLFLAFLFFTASNTPQVVVTQEIADECLRFAEQIKAAGSALQLCGVKGLGLSTGAVRSSRPLAQRCSHKEFRPVTQYWSCDEFIAACSVLQLCGV